MSKNEKKLLEFGIAGCFFGLVLLIMPGWLLLPLLVVPGLFVWWVACLMLSWWATSELDVWLESLQYKDLSDE